MGGAYLGGDDKVFSSYAPRKSLNPKHYPPITSIRIFKIGVTTIPKAIPKANLYPGKRHRLYVLGSGFRVRGREYECYTGCPRVVSNNRGPQR